MPVSLRMTTPPAALAVTLAAAKAHLRVDHAEDDALITRLIVGACADASLECGLGFGVASYLLVTDGFPPCGKPVGLGVRPLVSVQSFDYYADDGTDIELEAADYWTGLETGRLAPAEGTWPATQKGRPESVRVAFTAGTAAIPAQGTDAVLLIVGDRYENRGDGNPARRAIPDAARRLLWQLHPGDVS